MQRTMPTSAILAVPSLIENHDKAGKSGDVSSKLAHAKHTCTYACSLCCTGIKCMWTPS